MDSHAVVLWAPSAAHSPPASKLATARLMTQLRRASGSFEGEDRGGVAIGERISPRQGIEDLFELLHCVHVTSRAGGCDT